MSKTRTHLSVSNELDTCKKALEAMMEIYQNESIMDISGNLTGSTSTADIYNSIFEKCSRTVQRELDIEVFWNRVSRFKRKLRSAVAEEIRNDANSMPLTIKYVDQPLSENVEDESNNIIEALKLWIKILVNKNNNLLMSILTASEVPQ